MKETVIGVLVAAFTILITNLFGYLFAMKKDIRTQSIQYKTEMLDKVYTPIYKLLVSDIVPGDGYEYIDHLTFAKISDISEMHFNLVDPKLNSIIWILKEDVRNKSQYNIDERDFIYLDEDKELLNHVVKYHNLLRKSLGLPFESEWKRKCYEKFKRGKRKYKKFKRKLKIKKYT